MNAYSNIPASLGRKLPMIKLKHVLLVLVLGFISAGQVAYAGQTSYYVYDESGHVIGEYDQNGNPVQEHIYLGDRPVAVVTGGSSTSGTVDYVTTDQLNTPRVITDSSQTVLWSWNSDPFGNGQPTSPSFTYNLRFPGQYYDAETGHNYNYYRDYDPDTGRFTESDPLGIVGGANTFAYVDDDPVDGTDFSGRYTYSPNKPGSHPECNGADGIMIVVRIYNDARDACIGDCERQHELIHIIDLRNIGTNPCVGQPRGTIIGFDTLDELERSEIRAYQQEVACMRQRLKQVHCQTCQQVLGSTIGNFTDIIAGMQNDIYTGNIGAHLPKD